MAVTIYTDMVEAADMMPRAQRAAFLVALIDYGEKGIEPEGRPAWLPTFVTCKDRLNMSKEKREKAKRMAAARWGKDEDSTMQEDEQASCTSMMHEHDAELSRVEQSGEEKEKEGENGKRKRFTPPTPEEVSEYAREKGLSLDANDFCDYYGAQGWRLSNGNPMRDWRQAANRWARSQYRGGRDPKPNPFKGRYDHIRMVEEVG